MRKAAFVISILAGVLVLSAIVMLVGNDGSAAFTEAKIGNNSRAVTPHAPILIDGNADFSDTDDDGVSNPGAAGTESDPYIIENWDINASTADGIYIKNTNVYFIIRNCTIHDGKSTYKNGIYFYGVTNGKIENCDIYNNWYGIYLYYYSSKNNISECRIYNNSQHGILLYYSSNNNISASQIYNNSKGIYPYYSSNNNITACQIYNSYRGINLDFSSKNNIMVCDIYNNSEHGICLYYSSNNNITACQVYNNLRGIYLYESSNNNISACLIYNNSDYGIELGSSSNNKLRNNILANNTYNFYVYGGDISHFYQDIDTSNTINGKQIYYIIEQSNLVFDETMSIGYLGLVSCTNITIKNLELKNNYQGLLLVNTIYSTITANQIYNNSCGIDLCFSSNNNTISTCQIYNNSDYGIEILSSSYNNISACQFYNNEYGIYLESSSNNNIGASQIYNDSKGIYLSGSSNNNISASQIYNNSNYGIYLDYSSNNNMTNCGICNNSCDGVALCYSTHNIISNCRIYNNRNGMARGISLYESSNNTIINCEIYKNEYEGISLSHSLNNNITNCIISSNSGGIWLDYSSNNNIIGCSIYNSSWGWGIYLTFSLNIKVHYCNIYDNNNYGLHNYNSEEEYQVNATYNWWGSASGPGGVGPGTGNNISANVLYDPWLIEPYLLSITIIQSVNGLITNQDVTLVYIIHPLTSTGDPIPIIVDGPKNGTLYTSEGIYNITITVTDELGNSATAKISFIIDITPPTANAGQDQSVDEDTVVTFNGSASTDNFGIVNSTWTFFDGVERILYGVNPTYIFYTPGIYVVTLNVSDAAGNWAIGIVNVTVRDITLPEITNIQANPSVQTQSGYVNITCAVEDNVAVSAVNVSIKGPVGFTPINITMTKVGNAEYYYNLSYSIAGEYSYYIWVVDTSNNVNKSADYHFIITIAVRAIIDNREVNVVGIGNGTVSIEPATMPQSPPENLRSITCIKVTITGTLTYVNITIRYTEDDVAGLNESTLIMYYWDAIEGKWKSCNEIGSTGVDVENNIVWANVTSLTIFAPMAEKVVEVLPAPVNWLLYVGVTAIVIIAVSLIVVAKKRKK